MVTIRLARGGAKKRPYFHITVADSRRARDGKYIERVGFFNPIASAQNDRLNIDHERLDYWVSKGAQVTERVKNLIKESKLSIEDFNQLIAKKEKLRLVKLEKKKASTSETDTEKSSSEGGEVSAETENTEPKSTNNKQSNNEDNLMEKTEDIIDKVAEGTKEVAEGAAEAVTDVAEGAVDVAEEVVETAEDVVKDAAEAVTDVAEGAANVAGDVAETAEDVVEDAVDAVKDVAEGVVDVAEDVVDTAKEVAGDLAEGDVVEAVKDVAEGAVDVAEDVVETAVDVAEDAVEAVKDVAEGAADVVEDVIETAEDVVEDAVDAVKDVAEGAADAVGDAVDAVKDAFTSDDSKDDKEIIQMTYQDDDFILVGNFGRPIGLKGSIKLNSFTRPSENIKSYNSFFMKENSEFIELEVKKITTSGKNLIIFLNNCNSLDEAEETFKGREIFISKLDLPEVKDKFYWNDLIGLEVIIRSSEKPLGKVHSLLETGSNDVLIIKNPNQEDILIPFIMKQVILEVTEKSIYVDWEV